MLIFKAEHHETVTMRISIVEKWEDQIHRWNHREDLKCINYVVVPHNDDETPIWTPYIFVMNG